MRYRLPSLRTTVDRLVLMVRTVGFLTGVTLFAGLGLLDAGARRLWPAWREQEAAARWTGERLTALARRFFPLVLAVPCARRQVRVRRLVYPDTLRPGALGQVELVVENLGSEVWRGGGPHPCRLGVIEPWDRSAFYVPDRWLGPLRPAELPDGVQIAPLETTDFRVPIRAPSRPGRYREMWGMVIEGRNWIPTLRGIEVVIDVREG